MINKRLNELVGLNDRLCECQVVHRKKYSTMDSIFSSVSILRLKPDEELKMNFKAA